MAEQELELHPAHDAVVKACEDAQYAASAAGLSGHPLQVHGFLAMLEAFFQHKSGVKPLPPAPTPTATAASTTATAAQTTDDSHE